MKVKSLLFRATVFSAMVFMLAACATQVKEPSVAGSFYPAERAALREAVDGYLANAENRPVDGDLVALVSPHAGYVFSGHVAAQGYKQLKDVDTVIILGQSHQARFNGASIYAEGAFRTPLGDVPIDWEIAESLLNHPLGVDFYAEAYDKEHSIEVQLPFLQRVLDDFKIVPILIGTPTTDLYAYLADSLTAILSQRKNIVIVASTDLSHYHDYDTAVTMDTGVIGAISTMMGEKVENLVRTEKAELCGLAPVLLTMEVSRRLGANEGVLFKYANSGDVTVNKSRVVGYASVGFYRVPLGEEDKAELLDLARRAIIGRVKFGKTPEDLFTDNPKLHATGAAFVTIKRRGMLRGCIGDVVPMGPLAASVIRSAVAASSYDKRFPPMRPEELSDMEIEISVLSPLRQVRDIDDIEIGRDGLYLVKDKNAGLFLPQVPVEQGWKKPTYLKELSRKAGLPEDAWKKGDLYSFQAVVFGEGQSR